MDIVRCYLTDGRLCMMVQSDVTDGRLCRLSVEAIEIELTVYAVHTGGWAVFML